MEVCMSIWNTKIKDYNRIELEKASFIFDSTEKYLSSTIVASDEIKKTSFHLFSIIIAILSAVSSYMLLQCNFVSKICGDGQNLFIPSLSLIIGFFIAFAVLGYGCIKPRKFHYIGNEARNLMDDNLCNHSLSIIKLSGAVEMQDRIDFNNFVNARCSKFLMATYIIMILTIVVSLLLQYLLR
jgi:hypothetical protein